MFIQIVFFTLDYSSKDKQIYLTSEYIESEPEMSRWKCLRNGGGTNFLVLDSTKIQIDSG